VSKKEFTMRLDTVGLVATLALAVLVAPLSANAQPPGKGFRVGLLISLSFGLPVHQAFKQRLQELGYVEGQNLALEVRAAEGQFERLPGFAAELVRLSVDVIVVSGPEATLRAARGATETIPIVMRARDYDPIALGYVAGLARPGGNITGVVQQRLEVTAKQLELLKEALPTITRLAVLWDDAAADQYRAAEAAARSLGVQLQSLELRHPPYEFAGAFAAAQGQAEALLVLNSPIFLMQHEHLMDLVAKSRLPTMFGLSESARAGGLMSYDVNNVDTWRRVADYVDKILKGTKPADLPVEQPTKFELVLNLKTAQALGITFPPTAPRLGGRGDQVEARAGARRGVGNEGRGEGAGASLRGSQGAPSRTRQWSGRATRQAFFPCAGVGGVWPAAHRGRWTATIP
jgi:putative ABC transport system substrate-binding protein